MAATRRKPAPWSADHVAELLTAEMLVDSANHGVPGFDVVRALSKEWERALTSYVTAVIERYPTARKRARLRRMAECIVSAQIDWKAVADRISERVSEAKPRAPAAERPGNVIDLMEALKRSLKRHEGKGA